MLKIRHPILLVGALLVLISFPGVGQEEAGKGLPELIRGNEQFGRKLLQLVHSVAPNHNVVVSPISLTIALAAIQAHACYFSEKTCGEIRDAFGWGDRSLTVPAHMLLAAFEKPEATPCPHGGRLRLPCRAPDGTWITNTFLYRSTVVTKEPISPWFIQRATKYFGFKFSNTGMSRPTTVDLLRTRKSTGPLPPVSSMSDAWISSGTHLQTAWHGNTFSVSKPYQGEFLTTSGIAKRVEVLDSELEFYLYAKTDTFEAIALPCETGYMLAVLPAPEKDIYSLERELANQPQVVDEALKRQVGKVTMPTFRIRYESDLTEAIKAMGVKTIFEDLGSMVKIAGSGLKRVNQKIDLQVTRDGIRADAETVAGLVYGGILGEPKPFHMELNRPFVFLIRDEVTNALLFLGVVMDPTEQN